MVKTRAQIDLDKKVKIETEEKVKNLEAAHKRRVHEVKIETEEKVKNLVKNLEAVHKRNVHEVKIETEEKVKKDLEVSHERRVQELLENFEQRVTKFQREKDEMEKTIALFQREVEMQDDVRRDLQRLQKDNEEMAKTLAVLQAERGADTNAKKIEAIERALECVCCFTIRPRIHQCSLGHIICENCQLKLPAKVCPTCRTRYSGETIRNLFAEDVAKTLNLVQ